MSLHLIKKKELILNDLKEPYNIDAENLSSTLGSSSLMPGLHIPTVMVLTVLQTLFIYFFLA